jgi:hypothetical protein
MDELVEVAEDVLVEKDIKKYIKEEFTDVELTKQEHSFLIEYIKTGKGAKSYQRVFGSRFNDNVAGVYASRLLRKLRFTLSDYMSYTGHDDESICEALTKLKETDPKEYLKYMSKFKGYDTQKVEIDINSLPVLEITTSHENIHPSKT